MYIIKRFAITISFIYDLMPTTYIYPDEKKNLRLKLKIPESVG